MADLNCTHGPSETRWEGFGKGSWGLKLEWDQRKDAKKTRISRIGTEGLQCYTMFYSIVSYGFSACLVPAETAYGSAWPSAWRGCLAGVPQCMISSSRLCIGR